MSHLTKQRTYAITAPAIRLTLPEREGALSGATTHDAPTSTLSALVGETRERVAAHSIWIMTGARARDGDMIDPLGMETARFMQNPVVLWMHGAAGSAGPSGGIPIGRTLALRRDPEGIEADFEFLAGDPFAERVRNAWERGFIHAASIAWLTHEAAPLSPIASHSGDAHLPQSAGETLRGVGQAPRGPRGLRHTRTELLEWSLVPVPADPGAHREVYAAGLRALGFEDLIAGPDFTALVQASQTLHDALVTVR